MLELEKFLEYEQPTKYIVNDDNYDDSYEIPVLTAGQSFILGYTNEQDNVFPIEKLPVLIFDDFTTSVQYVDFPFKVKSSAMKILHPTNKANIKYFYYLLKSIKVDTNTHKRYWISEYSKRKIQEISIEEQIEIVKKNDIINDTIQNRKKMIEDCNNYINSKFTKLFIDNVEYSEEELKSNIIEMFIGPFGSSLKNECFVSKDLGYCVVYEQKHAINKNINDFRYVSLNKYNELKRFNILPNDIIVSCRGTNGKTYIIPENAPLGIMHPSIMKIRLDQNKYNPYFFEMLLSRYFDLKKSQSNGAIIKMAIKAKELEKEKFIRPDISIQNSFVSMVNEVQKQINMYKKDIDDLEQLLQIKMNEYFN